MQDCKYQCEFLISSSCAITCGCGWILPRMWILGRWSRFGQNRSDAQMNYPLWYHIEVGAFNPKPIDNGWKRPRFYILRCNNVILNGVWRSTRNGLSDGLGFAGTRWYDYAMLVCQFWGGRTPLKDTFSGLFCLTVERDVLLSEWRLW